MESEDVLQIIKINKMRRDVSLCIFQFLTINLGYYSKLLIMFFYKSKRHTVKIFS